MTRVGRRLGLVSLAGALSAASCGASPAAPGRPPEERRVRGDVVVLGDSLAVSPSRSVNFPAALQDRLDAHAPGWTIVNAGVSGDTTAGGARRLEAALTPDTRILLLALGANDGLRGVQIESVEANLVSIIARAQARGIQVLLCGMLTPPAHGWDYALEFHRLFPRVARAHDVPLVPFLLEGVALNPEMNGEDAIHPNAAGARRIAETVWPYLEPLVRTAPALTSR